MGVAWEREKCNSCGSFGESEDVQVFWCGGGGGGGGGLLANTCRLDEDLASRRRSRGRVDGDDAAAVRMSADFK